MEEAEKPHIPGLRDGDYLGDAPIDFSIDSQAVVQLDYNSSSIGLDFGIAGTKLKKVQLVPQLKTQTHRLTANTLELFVSNDNSFYQLVSREEWVFDKDEQGTITITFKETIDTRYLKIHVRFDDRDILFNPVDKATFLNQLSSMVRVYQQASERTEEYQYDAAGNRRKLSLRLVDLFHYDYVYYENSDRLKSDGKYTYAYDEAGNLIRKTKMGGEDGGEQADWAYEYDLLNRLRRVAKNGKIVSSYRYDPEGFRVVKQTAEQTIHYVFEGTEPIFEQNITTGQIKSYVYALGKHLARVDGVIGDPEAKVYFYHTDHLGSIKAVSNKVGEVVWNADYLAFGTRFGMSADADFEEWHGFTGKEYDPDTGLSYFNARWYDSELGRFISEDPAADPNSPNLYTYCGNNPLVRVDPTGMLFEGVKNAASKVANAAKNVVKGTINAVKNVVKGVANTVNSAVKSATNTLTKAFSGNSNIGGFSLKMVNSHEEYRTPVELQVLQEGSTASVIDLNPLTEDDWEKRWEQAQENQDVEALAALLEQRYVGFKYNPQSPTPLATQFFASKQEPLSVSIGLSGNIWYYGVAGSYDMTSGKFDASKSFIPTAIVGFSLDFSMGKGAIETSAGFSKYLSIGALWDFNNKGSVDFGGLSLHIGPGVSLPMNLSVEIPEYCVPFPGL